MQPKTKTILIVLLSFLLGGVCGYYVGFLGKSRAGTEGSQRFEWKKMFAQRLQLDSLQASQVDSVLESFRTHMSWHRKGILLVRDTTRMEIRKILTQEQNKRFDEYIKEMDEHESRRRERDRDR